MQLFMADSASSSLQIFLKMLFLMTILCFVVAVAAADPCALLCAFDGPLICTGGSWTTRANTCHKYFYKGDREGDDYCYHTAATRETCPASGIPVRPIEVAGLLLLKQKSTTEAPDDIQESVWFPFINVEHLISNTKFSSLNGEPCDVREEWMGEILRSFTQDRLLRFTSIVSGKSEDELFGDLPWLKIRFHECLEVHSESGTLHVPFYGEEEDMKNGIVAFINAGALGTGPTTTVYPVESTSSSTVDIVADFEARYVIDTLAYSDRDAHHSIGFLGGNIEVARIRATATVPRVHY
jgi:hypothetical protein